MGCDACAFAIYSIIISFFLGTVLTIIKKLCCRERQSNPSPGPPEYTAIEIDSELPLYEDKTAT